MTNIALIIILPILSYFMGNCNWAIIISKIKKQNIREMGSGNPGTLNMSRNFGLKLGLLTFFLDILKGAIPVLVAFFVFHNQYFKSSNFPVSEFSIYLCGFSVVLGHIYPVLLKFKGGKGIASSIGVFIVCEAVHGLWVVIIIMSLVAAVAFIYFTEFGAMGSFIAIIPSAISGSIRLYIYYGNFVNKSYLILYLLTNIFIFLICFLTCFAHRKNIDRMLSGDEHPTSIKAMVVKMKEKKMEENNKI
ncbi:MAG: glycerol-3-phosphate acyltransferase [Clostridia bacterium]|nr:glycerol-3-phosphate acyltransferase [Clostridia bacterium]